MAKKKRIDLKLIVADALDHYHNYVKPSIKDSTKRQNESLLSEFYRFVDTLKARERTMKIFSQKGLNRYKEYLIDKMNSPKTDGKKRNFGVGHLNRCGSLIERLINNVLYPKEIVSNHVVWIKLEDSRREDQKGHFPLLDDEVAAIENCSGLSDVEEEYRDIFLLQIESGQRVSDLANILTGEYTVGQVDEYKCIILATKKEDVPAAVVLTPKVGMLLERIKTHKHVDPKEFKEKTEGLGNNTYNEAIRRIAKKAGLDRIIVKIYTNKKVEKKPLYEVITNHDARSTFITNKIRAGMTPDEIAVFTGHVNGEMIRRIYAQPTIEDKLRNVKRFLSSDKNEKDSNSPTDTSSKKPNDPETIVHKEATATMPISTDSEPSSIFESDEVIEYENYIRNLNDRVNAAINEMNAALQGHDLDELDNNDELKSFIDVLENHKQRFKSKENIIVFWQDFEAFIKENADPDAPKTHLDLDRLFYLRTLIDYIRDNHIFEDAIESLEEKLHIICEENPDASFISQIMYHFKILWPIEKFRIVFLKMMQFIQENRPIADDTMFEDDNSKFKSRIDWNLVFNELQRIPAKKLDALIQNTNCSHDVKTVLYNSVKNGDFNTFSNTIKTHENDVRILLINAYDNHFARMIIKLNEYLFNIGKSGPENPIEIMNRAIEKILLQNPYVDSGNDESIPDFQFADVQEANFKEQQLWLLDNLLRVYDGCYKYAYPSEEKIFKKVRSLVDFNKHPELKDAYDEYLAKQKAVSNQTDVEATIVSEEDKEKKRKSVGTRVNYLPVSIRIQNLDVDKLIRLLTEKDKLNKCKQFITVLESTDNVNVATCLKHFLGTHSNTPLSFRLKWNGHTKASLKFLIRLITNTNEKASRSNVIDTSNREGISPEYVSQWAGSGELWAPVCNVFGGSTGYMMSVGLGDEGSKARKINLEQYNTIADIYFECKL